MRQNISNKMFIKAYDNYADAIFRHCYFRISNRERAKELMQETFTRAWLHFSRDSREIENIKAFLYKIANNLIIDEYRKKKESSLEDLEESGFQLVSNERFDTETKLEAEKIMKLIDQLNENYREVIMMRYIDEFSVKEIAEILKESEDNISVRIHRALKKVKEIIKNNEKNI